MKSLNKMLLRDIAKTKGQFIAISIVVFCGITLFMASFASYKNLVGSTTKYYTDYRFLDYYATARNIDSRQLEALNNLEGVSSCDIRMVMDVSMETVEGRKTILRMTTLPSSGQPAVNQLHIANGNLLDHATNDSCLLSESFARFYKIAPGDTIRFVIGSKTETLKVAGIVNSPEYIWALRSSSTILPSDEDFGILYVKTDLAKTILGDAFAFNEAHFIFQKTADRKAVIRKIEETLKPNGFLYGVERKDQLSYNAVDSEIKELEELAGLFPLLFLSVVAVTIYVMLIKLISNQRSLIGTMKAIGYSDKNILLHYILHSVMIGLAGSIPGCAAGYMLSMRMTSMYNGLFKIPEMAAGLHLDATLFAVCLSLLFCISASFVAARRILHIQPAQAMRSEPPKAGRRVLLENVDWVWKRLGFRYKMSIRNVFRNRQRTMLTIMGLCVTIMMLLASMFFLDTIDYIMNKHFKEFIAYDTKVAFTQPLTENEINHLKGLDLATHYEPVLEVNAAVSSEAGKGDIKTEDILVTVMNAENPFLHFIDESGKLLTLQKEGIMLDSTAASKLSAKTGDWIRLKVGKYGQKLVQVNGISKQYTAFSSYMDYAEAARLFGISGHPATSMLISVNSGAENRDRLERALYGNPEVLSMESSQKAYNSFHDMMSLFYEFIGGIVVFGFIMGFVIVFNTTFVNIMERQRELATLKVLGYKLHEIRSVILRENMIVGVLAILPGLALGVLVSRYLAGQFATSMFKLEIVIYPRTYFVSIASGFVFILLSQLATRRSITNLEMVDVLKNREE